MIKEKAERIKAILDGKSQKDLLTDRPGQRILSFDGGGIYGLATAVMLRRLCEADPDFMDGDDIFMFAGTSAGALTSLMLANQERPRDFVLSGELERYWGKPGTYANQANPFNAFWSWFGVTAWLGVEDFQALLRETFGDKTLGDLHHNVLIGTFDWSGGGAGHWTPRMFTNLRAGDAREPVVNVAYGAASPPGLRGVINGLGDAGVFAPDPCLNAIATTVRFLAQELDPHGDQHPAGFLTQLAAMSLGVATVEPAYFTPTFNLGSNLFNSVLPTNIQQGALYPPIYQYTLDGPTDNTVFECRQLLGEAFHRLDPQVVGPPNLPPTLIAVSLARFDAWREYLVRNINQAMNDPKVDRAIADALDFIHSPSWHMGRTVAED